MSDEITYARVGGPPEDWHRLRILDASGEDVPYPVIEVNTEEGWLRCHKIAANGSGGRFLDGDGKLAEQTVRGRFRIVYDED